MNASPTGCPVGCQYDEPHENECPTNTPAPLDRRDVCCTLGLDVLRSDWAARWHEAGHPEFRSEAS